MVGNEFARKSRMELDGGGPLRPGRSFVRGRTELTLR